MADLQICPDSDLLRKTAAGDFSDADLVATIDHLQSCDHCRQRFESFFRQDSPARGSCATPVLVELAGSSPGTGEPHDAVARILRVDAPPPAELGPGFRVLQTLGIGGMGTVRKCFDTRLGRIVAIKLVRSDRFAPDCLERTAREARAQASLNHPNIVPVFEIGQHAGLPMIVMEFLAGGSLKDRIARNLLSPRQAAWTIAAIARGLQHAHDAGVIHRDLKPSNILLTAGELNGEPGSAIPKIADFGLARFLSEGSDLTAVDAVPGTPAYLAPELVAAVKSPATPASDLYALGVILYECLTGRPPFTGGSYAQLISLIETATPVSPGELTAGISLDLETICLKCLRKNPADRYPSALALAEDLEAFLECRPIQARPVPPLVRSWRWCMRNRRLAAAIGVAALSLVSLAVGGVAVAISQAQLLRLADHNGQMAVAQAKKAAESEREARSQRDQARLQFLASSHVLHDIGSMLLAYESTQNNAADLKKINIEFQKRVIQLTEPYLNRPDFDTDSPEILLVSLFNAARAYDELGDSAEAARKYERLLDLARRTTPDPIATEIHRHLVTASTLNLADIHKRHGRLDQAIDLLEPFWLHPVDPGSRRPPDTADLDWHRLRLTFGTELRELYESKGLSEKATQVHEEIELSKRSATKKPTSAAD